MDAFNYLKTWLCSFCVMGGGYNLPPEMPKKVANLGIAEPEHGICVNKHEVEISTPSEKIAEYKVSEYALQVISDRVTNTVKGKEAIQAIGEPKYLLSKEDINLLVEHAVMGTFEDIDEHLSVYKGRELK